MFTGEYLYTIDHKKRLAIPSKFRKDLKNKAFITRGIDNCLVLFPLKEWEVEAKRLQNLPSNIVEARKLKRIMFSGAMEVSFDKLGRILIPEYLKEYANLKKDVSIIGLSNKIEIWNEKKWQEYKNKTEKQVGDIVGNLGDLGI